MPLRYRRRAHGERAFRSIQKQAASGYHLRRISFALSAERDRGLAVNIQNVGSHFDHLPRLVSRKPSYAQPPACPPSNPRRHRAPPTRPRARANSLPAVQTEPPHEDTLALYALARPNGFRQLVRIRTKPALAEARPRLLPLLSLGCWYDIAPTLLLKQTAVFGIDRSRGFVWGGEPQHARRPERFPR